MTATRDLEAEERAYRDLHGRVKAELTKGKRNLSIIDDEIIDTETGEIVTGKYEVRPVVSAGKAQARAEGQRVKQELSDHHEQNGGFVFAFYDSCQKMADRFPELNQPDLARLLFIGTYVNFGTNHLTYANGRIINKKALSELLGMSRNKFTGFYTKMKDNEILTETEAGLMLNAEVFYRGFEDNAPKNAKHLQRTRVYRKTMRDLYQMFGGASAKKLGIIYSVLPFINFNVNIVCTNPQTKLEDEINAMSLGELADILGYKDVTKFSETLRGIKHEGKSVFKLVEDNGDARSKYIVVNPNLVYAGKGGSLKGLKILFR